MMKKLLKSAVISSLLLIASFNLYAQSAAQKFLWENPSSFPTDAKDCRFPQTVSSYEKDKPSIVFWEEVDEKSSLIYIGKSCTEDGLTWDKGTRISQAISYSGSVPELYSVADNKDVTAVAALTDINEISLFVSTDNGRTFETVKLEKYDSPLIAPRIYASREGFVLFVSLAKNEDFSLLYASSPDGKNWSSFQEFKPGSQFTGASSPFLPYLLNYKNEDIVIYQSRFASGDQLSFQLFSTVTKDNGKTWSLPVMVTDESSLLEEDEGTFFNFNNQKPYLCEYKNEIYLVWERKAFSASSSDVIASALSADGKLKGERHRLNTLGNCSRPVLFSFGTGLYALWFDSLRGNETVYYSQFQGTFWDDAEVLSSGNTTFPMFEVTGGTALSFVWQSSGTRTSAITQLVSDHSAKPPLLNALSFKNGKRYATEKASVKISAAEDSSGIQGFSWIWTQDENAEPDEKISIVSTSRNLDLKATEDGTWYFKARQQDFAGNWSDSSTITFVKDTTPPLPPVIQDFPVDSMGLAKTNSFTFSWQGEESDTDIAGYTWSLEYIDSIPKKLAVNASHPLKLDEETVVSMVEELLQEDEEAASKVSQPPKYIRGDQNKTTLGYYNRKNGVYVFSVAAIDTVGNIGEPSKLTVVANKYIPSTYINAVNSQSDPYGNISLEIIGGGFTYEGTITTIYLDRDGKAPYDYILSAQNGDFTVSSDSRISNINLSEIEAADYRIGLIHSDRGLYFTAKAPLSVKEYGTVKTKYNINIETAWKAVQDYYARNTYASTIVLIVTAVFFIIALAGLIAGLSGAAKEAAEVKAEVTALIEGGTMPNQDKNKITNIKKKGIGLRTKLTFNSMMLVIIINLLLIITFRIIITQTQEQTLSKGLYDRVNVILNSIDSGARVYLPLNDSMSLQDTVNQISALDEAEYATITGYSEDGSNTGMDFVWATTDSEIGSKIDTEAYIYGRSRLTDPVLSGIINENTAALNKKATDALGDIPVQLSEVTKEAQSLLTKTDEESIERRSELDNIRKQLIQRTDRILSEVSTEGTGSTPSYDSTKIVRTDTSYIFYKPVLYRHGNDQTYVNGMIFVSVSTESLIAEMDAASRTIMIISFIMLAVAIILAVLSSFLVSSIVVRPINTLVDHVSMIRDTEDKEKLEGKDLKLKSKDEIGMLGETVNEMTQGLVEAAKASKNLTIGKEVQTKFIPLQVDKNGNTLTTGSLAAQGADFFSYYAGADDLSGDYFDYKQIDREHYAVIKCDVSGHGVPAALIMVEVATLFLNYFQNWNMKNPQQGINLSPVVGHINDLLESRGFKGRFAAFTLAIINTVTGECWFCNAGDNLVHIYDGQERKKKVITLQETPAAGMFSTDLIEMKGGYKVSKLTLKKDDILFLYTDGIEEAKRLFRDQNYNLLVNKESENKDEEDGEELGPERVTAIIESVYARQPYVLTKQNNPDELKELTFDFTTCDPTAESAIMALVSVEKVFRMYKPKSPKPSDKVKCDTKIDDFLRVHFKQYNAYCSQRSTSDTESNVIFYNGVQADPQYDDLTLIAIKKN